MALGELERSLMHYNEKVGLLWIKKNKQRSQPKIEFYGKITN